MPALERVNRRRERVSSTTRPTKQEHRSTEKAPVRMPSGGRQRRNSNPHDVRIAYTVLPLLDVIRLTSRVLAGGDPGRICPLHTMSPGPSEGWYTEWDTRVGPRSQPHRFWKSPLHANLIDWCRGSSSCVSKRAHPRGVGQCPSTDTLRSNRHSATRKASASIILGPRRSSGPSQAQE